MIDRLKESKWVYVLLSIVLAFLFWFYVRASVNPTSPTWIHNIPVVQTGTNVLTRQGLTVAGLSQETVSLRIEAPATVQDGLARNRDEITVSVDVSKCVEGENKLTFTPNWPANINTENIVQLDQKPDTITVTVEKLHTQTFPVEFQLQGKVADGYQAGTAAISPETVVISGPVEQVSQVARVVVILEDDNLDSQFAGDLPLTLLDREGNPLTDLEVTLDSKSAYVVLPVVIVKEVPLTVNFLLGGGVTSEEYYTYEIEPKTITVSGAEADLRELTEISLGSVDLAKVVGSNTLTFPINLDPSLENVSGLTSASVTVTIQGLSTRNFNVDNIQLINKPDGYTVTSATQARTVVVRGREEDLDAIDASLIRMVADLSEITALGTYPVSVRVYLDASSTVGVIGDYAIIVNVSK